MAHHGGEGAVGCSPQGMGARPAGARCRPGASAARGLALCSLGRGSCSLCGSSLWLVQLLEQQEPGSNQHRTYAAGRPRSGATAMRGCLS